TKRTTTARAHPPAPEPPEAPATAQRAANPPAVQLEATPPPVPRVKKAELVEKAACRWSRSIRPSRSWTETCAFRAPLPAKAARVARKEPCSSALVPKTIQA